MYGFQKTDMRKFSSLCLFMAMLCFVSAGAQALEQNTVESYLAKAKASGEKPNHLINQSSPYLLQHAYNPVNWYPWGEEAFEKARRENKPIFLSIGYSTCHWCHVMEHESFENKAIASLINKYFVAIKVDREERPDIDRVYMAATELIYGVGGWPMTVFLNLKLQPFHAQTYIPAKTHDHQRGLEDLLPQIHNLWVKQRAHVDAVAKQVTDRIRADAETRSTAVRLDKDIVKRAFSEIRASFDQSDGGFGDAPKFPRPGMFDFLLTLASQKGPMAVGAEQMMQKTLTAMAQGGIFDQVGGGFHRYSVDSQWQVPHFEKMLYSQALMTTAYLRMYEIDPQPLYKNVVQVTLDFVLREMTSPQGGFYSALDADSQRPDKKGEHGEGAYYLWSDAELKTVLSVEELKFARAYYEVSHDGNIYSDPQNEFTGLNILHVSEEYSSKALTDHQVKLLVSIKHKLLLARNHRPRPHLDDKIITAWNGMMISALAQAGMVFKDKNYIDVATQAAEFVRAHLFDKKTGKLYRRIRGEHAGIAAGLGDYAWTVRGLLDLYHADNDKQWLALAITLSDKQNAQFLDKTSGGYFDASDKDASLLFRFRPIYDDALPAANAIALANLEDLYRISRSEQWKTNAKGWVAAFAGDINANPSAAAMALSVLSRRH
jgi:uncharacterized protein